MKNNFLAIIVALLFSASVVYGADLRVFTTPQGGTGTGVVPSYGQVLTGNANGTYTPTATSSLRISIGSATSTEPLMAAYFVSTSTTATSTFSGGVSLRDLNILASDADSAYWIYWNGTPFISTSILKANTVVGLNAFNSNVNGISNTATGYKTLFSNVDGDQNTGNGRNALYSNTIGRENTGIGYNALYSNTNGGNNTAIGSNAGFSDGTISTLSNLTNSTAIGSNAQVTASNSIVLGGTGSFGVNVGIGTTSPTYTLSVEGSSTLGNQALAGYFTATSTTATSNFSGGLNVTGDTKLTGGLGVGATANTTDGTIVVDGSFIGAINVANGTIITKTTVSSANPPYSFIGDTDTGMGQFSLGANTVSLATAGATRLTVGETGNVGIGITFPLAVLNLKAGTTASNSAPLKFTSGSLMNTAEAGAIEYLSNQFYIRGSDGLSVAGNVGIGTTTPYAKLSVVGETVSSFFTATSTTATSTISGPLKLGSTGTSATTGNATLVGGTVAVSTGAAVSTGFVHLTRKTSGGTIGTAITYTITNGSFTINSDNILDTSTFSYLVTN